MSKLGALGRGIGTIFLVLTRTVVCILQYIALSISLGLAVYTVGDYTRQVIHDKKQILDFIYWRDPKRSGIALAASLVILYLFAQFTVLSVFAYVALAALSGAIGFRVFKIVEARFKNDDGSNPFKHYLEQEIVVPQEKLHAQVEVVVEHARNVFKYLRHLFLVENLVDSVKFGLLLYTLTYIGAWFSGLTLAFFFIAGLFSVPKVYELNKEPINNYIAITQEHIEKIQHTIEGKLPFLKKQVDAEKKEH